MMRIMFTWFRFTRWWEGFLIGSGVGFFVGVLFMRLT